MQENYHEQRGVSRSHKMEVGIGSKGGVLVERIVGG